MSGIAVRRCDEAAAGFVKTRADLAKIDPSSDCLLEPIDEAKKVADRI